MEKTRQRNKRGERNAKRDREEEGGERLVVVVVIAMLELPGGGRGKGRDCYTYE